MSILIPVAHGSESLETVTLVNLLRRAGLEVNLSSAEPETMIKATRGNLHGPAFEITDLVSHPLAHAIHARAGPFQIRQTELPGQCRSKGQNNQVEQGHDQRNPGDGTARLDRRCRRCLLTAGVRH